MAARLTRAIAQIPVSAQESGHFADN